MGLPVDIKAAKGGAEWKKEPLKGHGLKHATTSKPEKWWTPHFIAVRAFAFCFYLYRQPSPGLRFPPLKS